MDIQVNTMAMEDRSFHIRGLKNELTQTMEQIELLILSVDGAWQGDAEKAFAEKILYVKNQFSHIAAFFEEYATLLDQFSREYQRQESDIASKINLS